MSRRIALIGLGGTIATAPDEAGYARQKHRAQDIASTLPSDLASGLEFLDIDCGPSRNMSLAQLLELAQSVHTLIEGGIEGVVITHGTDTIEETAYLLALTVPMGVPIVLTGAMRRPHDPGADGPANLVAAITAVRSGALDQHGPVVLLGDQIHAARWATKATSMSPSALASPGSGPVAYVSEGRVHVVSGPAADADYLGLPSVLTVEVALIWSVVADSGGLIRAAAGFADGLVVAGVGGGHLSSDAAAAVKEAIHRGLPVVLSSRTHHPHVLSGTYGGPGSEQDLLAAGAIRSPWLAPLKARLRLIAALSLQLPVGGVFDE